MCQYSVFYGEYENEKKTEHNNLIFPDGDLNPGFLEQVPTHNLNFEEDQINRAQGSLKNLDFTLELR